MAEYVRFDTDKGSVVVEVAEGEAGLELASRDGVIAGAKRKLQDSLVEVRDAAVSTLEVFRDGTVLPDDIEVEFGIKLNAEVGAVVAKTALEGHFVVKLHWHGDTEVERS